MSVTSLCDVFSCSRAVFGLAFCLPPSAAAWHVELVAWALVFAPSLFGVICLALERRGEFHE